MTTPIHSEPTWLREYRTKNDALFLARPLKKSRYSNLTELDNIVVTAQKQPKEQVHAPTKVTSSSTSVQVYSWETALASPSMAERLTAILAEEHPAIDQYEAFINAHFTSGTIMYIPRAQKDEVIEVTIDAPNFVPIKNIIIIEKGVTVTILEKIVGNTVLLNTTHSIGEEAHVTFYRESSSEHALTHERTIAGAHAHVLKTKVFSTEKVVKSMYVNQMSGDGSMIDESDVVFLAHTQRADVQMISLHKGKSTEARTNVKNVLRDTSRQMFDGLIKILPGAQLTNSYLQANSMMLSADATSVNIPKLEIEASDVKATHSATVEHLEEDKLFYLQTRGLDKHAAEEIVVTAFLQSNLAEQPDVIKERVAAALEKKMHEARVKV